MLVRAFRRGDMHKLKTSLRLLVSIDTQLLDSDPLALFLSLSSVIVAFAFMIGSAASKYFEGILCKLSASSSPLHILRLLPGSTILFAFLWV